MSKTVELVLQVGVEHGEGPVWNERENILYWVDITGCALHLFNTVSRQHRRISTPGMLGAVAPRKSGGVIAALEKGFAFINTDNGKVAWICDPEAELCENRFNDGKCDPAGRFWAGTCSLSCDVGGAGSLYCLEKNLKVRNMLGNLTISNGLAWSPDHSTLYFIDTPTFEIWAFDYDVETGNIQNQRSVVAVLQQEGYPDGMTIDAEGMLWVAHWGTSRVCRWNPESGKKLGEIRLPVQNVSSCTFGGPELDQLYITTSRLGLDEQGLRDQPQAGGLFRVVPGVRGLQTHEFAG